jgi:hypothetical protein
MFKVLSATPNGNIPTIRFKLILSAITMFIIFVAAYIPDLIYIGRYYGYSGVDLPLTSVYGLTGGIPIWGHIAVILLLRFLVFVCVTLIVLHLSLKIRNNAYTALFGVGILLLPLFLHRFGFSLLNPVSLHGLLVADGTNIKVVQLVVLIAIAVFCTRFIFRRFGKA